MSNYKDSFSFQNQKKYNKKPQTNPKPKSKPSTKWISKEQRLIEDDTSKGLLLINTIQNNATLIIFLHLKNYKDNARLLKTFKDLLHSYLIIY